MIDAGDDDSNDDNMDDTDSTSWKSRASPTRYLNMRSISSPGHQTGIQREISRDLALTSISPSSSPALRPPPKSVPVSTIPLGAHIFLRLLRLIFHLP